MEKKVLLLRRALAICFALIVCQMLIVIGNQDYAYASDDYMAKYSAETNGTISGSLPWEQKVEYKITVDTMGVLNITGSQYDRKNIDVEIKNASGEKIASSNDHYLLYSGPKMWLKNGLTNQYDLFLSAQVVPGTYYVILDNFGYYSKGSGITYDYSFNIGFDKISKVKSGSKLSKKLECNGIGMYKISLKKKATLKITGTTPGLGAKQFTFMILTEEQ